MFGILQLHKTDVNPFRKLFMRFHQRTDFQHRCGINIVHQHDRMRITHRQGADFFFAVISNRDHIGRGLFFGCKWDTARLKLGFAHINGDRTIRLNGRINQTGSGFYRNAVFIAQPLFANKAGKTACTVTAL